MTKQERVLRNVAAGIGTFLSVSFIICILSYLYLSISSVFDNDLAVPDRFQDEEAGVVCYYYAGEMDCFALEEEDTDDSYPEDEWYEQAKRRLNGKIKTTT